MADARLLLLQQEIRIRGKVAGCSDNQRHGDEEHERNACHWRQTRGGHEEPGHDARRAERVAVFAAWRREIPPRAKGGQGAADGQADDVDWWEAAEHMRRDRVPGVEVEEGVREMVVGEGGADPGRIEQRARRVKREPAAHEVDQALVVRRGQRDAGDRFDARALLALELVVHFERQATLGPVPSEVDAAGDEDAAVCEARVDDCVVHHRRVRRLLLLVHGPCGLRAAVLLLRMARGGPRAALGHLF